jgi:hypothetical protein
LLAKSICYISISLSGFSSGEGAIDETRGHLVVDV